MFYKYKYIKPIIFLILLISLISLVSYIYIIKEEKHLLQTKYEQYIKHIDAFTENLIEDKKNATLIIAITLSKDDKVRDFIKNKESKTLDYKDISFELKEKTNYKNVWIQIVDLEGNSLYRSWTNIKSDLNFRKDMKTSLIDKKISSSISVGHFDMTIKGRAPIYENENVIGFMEVITHFNSISDQLKNQNIDSIILADKKYKNTILYPFSNQFIGDYYVSNKNFSDDLLTIINNYNIENFLAIDNYLIKENNLIHIYKLSSPYDENLGYIINFTKLSNIDIENIKSFKSQLITNIFILFLILGFSFIIYIYNLETKNAINSTSKLRKHIKLLRTQQQYKQSILDSQTTIIVITNGEIIINANKRLFDFFKDVKTLIEFRNKYICICSAFLDMKDENYIIDKDYDGRNWAEHILANQNKAFKVAMLNHEKKLRHFTINVSYIDINNNIIVTLTDITTEIEQISLNKEKDRLLYQQSKISAISDTLKNIAHHWRQPLSVISTIASGIKLEKELEILDDSRLIEQCENIVNNTNKLSSTIDNFSNFFTDSGQIENFELIETINEILNFLSSIFEKNNIKYEFKYDENRLFTCDKTDFSQAILNILDNSIFALINNKNINERIILIEFVKNKLFIKDSANGIDENILPKVFEPYFTTKHQSYGIGLGLYIVEEFFVKKLGYKVDVNNVTFEYKNEKYEGTNFIIDFN